jgi:hypothetical protein
MRAALTLIVALSQLPYAREALNLGRTGDDALYAAFSEGYTLAVSDPVERAEIVTEFRRAVMIVRDRVRLGDYATTAQDLTKAVQPFEGQVAFVVEVRLHPLHVYAKPPAYDLYVATGSATPPLAAKLLKRAPVYPAGVMEGASWTSFRVDASFPRAAIEEAAAPMLVLTDEQANVIWKARIDLSRYR